MINLITGGPGSGKTCYLIGELLKYEEEGRNLYVHGVPGLTIKHERIYCESPFCTVCEDKPLQGARLASDWPDYVGANDVVVLDDVQHIWRPRGGQGRSSEVPRSLAGLETARHLGADFWLVTQSPSLVDIHARRMVTRHIHIKYSSVFGRVKYEWAECQTDPQQSWTGDTVKGTYTLDKKHFKYYKSADLHTVQDRKKPLSFYAYGVAFLMVPLAIWWAFSSFGDMGEISDEDTLVASNEFVSFSDSLPDIDRGYSRSTFFPDSSRGDIYDRAPEVDYRPESAPAYRHLVEIKDYPRLAGCVYTESTNHCQCYTQQATRVQVSYDYCRNFVSNPPFNPYLESSSRVARAPQLSDSRPINSVF